MVAAALKVCFILWLEKAIFYEFSWIAINRPICVATLVGLVLGDIPTALVVGATLEAVFMGFQSMGGSIPPDAENSTAIVVAYVILTGATVEEGLSLAMPIATLIASVSGLTSPIFASLSPLWEKLAAEAKPKKFLAILVAYQWFIGPLTTLIIVFVAIAFGIDGLSNVINSLPAWVMSGLSASAALMTAVGMAIMMNMIWNGQVVLFFFMGYVLAKYLGLGSLPIAFIGLTIASVIFFNEKNMLDLKKSLQKTETETEEDFF